ncbi:hypothetical protein MSSIH_2136 [Methanosarcina siciliae HI350]|uniref:Uncharacterized protein n=1 Tax=Methanosarcina siciliae HI350 TaxID=1434119 RepID=A0A0E3LAY4_9EURY|nr:hypothetical protein [Methanosarcina siciliae]AKB32826.1 hypothetical protein MSSIH_2136 [Methanosarcina siciliae HI350]
MKLSMEQIRDLEEPEDPDHPEAEQYHISILQNRECKSFYNDLSGDAERALRSTQDLTWKQFLKKWG